MNSLWHLRGCLTALSDNYRAGNNVWCVLWCGLLGCTPSPRALSINIFSPLIHFKRHSTSWSRWSCLVPFVPALLLVPCHSEESSVPPARLGSAPELGKGHPCLFQGHLTGSGTLCCSEGGTGWWLAHSGMALLEFCTLSGGMKSQGPF